MDSKRRNLNQKSMTVGDYMQHGFAHANRSIMSSKDIFSGESGGSVQVGVGIFFQQEGDGNVYVKTIVSAAVLRVMHTVISCLCIGI